MLVCDGQRLRGYIHRDGKNHYAKERYVDPYSSESNATFDGLITTGYVPASHYATMPMRLSVLKQQYALDTVERYAQVSIIYVFFVCSLLSMSRPNLLS